MAAPATEATAEAHAQKHKNQQHHVNGLQVNVKRVPLRHDRRDRNLRRKNKGARRPRNNLSLT